MRNNLFRQLPHLALTVAGVCLLVLGAATSAICQTTGKHDFEHLCASCHGADGTGKGRMLTEANPPDLTELSLRNGGKFPFAHVYMIVDGREMAESHKRFAMPFWGEYLRQQQGRESTPATDAAVKQRILDIVRYLETIQRK
jgi:mono/diheme cytochrome c family protein